MDELMVKALRGEATDFELRQLERWRTDSPDHDAECRAVEMLWNRGSEVVEPPVPIPPPLSEILEEGNRRRESVERKTTVLRFLRSPWVGWGIPAAAVLAMLFFGVWGPSSTLPNAIALSPVETASGLEDITTLALSDGSVVRIAPETRIEFPPSPGERNVLLEGKAFFAVASGDTPFVVRTTKGDVRVWGTRFEVLVEDGGLRVIVVEGLVEVEWPGGTVTVGPGQMAILPDSGSPEVIDEADIRSLLNWPGGLLIFQETPLSEVVAELETHFGADFHISSDELGSRRITAWFGDEPVEEVVSALCMVGGVRCTLEENLVTIDP